MKIFYSIAMMILLLAPLGRGQTNALPAGPVVISSRTGFFQLNTRTALYQGNVHVDDPQMKLRCEWLVASLPAAGGRLNHIVCETNVVIDYTDQKGQTNHITSDKAVYDYHVIGDVTNETITFTGSPKIENADAIITGEPIIWNRADGNFVVMDENMLFKKGFGDMPVQTNKP